MRLSIKEYTLLRSFSGGFPSSFDQDRVPRSYSQIYFASHRLSWIFANSLAIKGVTVIYFDELTSPGENRAYKETRCRYNVTYRSLHESKQRGPSFVIEDYDPNGTDEKYACTPEKVGAKLVL